jgi:uroporphyrin-3 C-methyltransferase
MTSKNNTPEIDSADTQEKVEATTKSTESSTPQSTVEPSIEKNEEQQAQLEKQAKRGTKLGTVAIIIAIILSGGAAGYAYKVTQEYQAKINALEAKLNSSNTQLSAFKSEAASQTADVARRAEVELSQHQKSLESLQLAFSELKGRRPNDWLLAETDYLVKLAGRKLFLERDVVSATHLMESADQRIAALNDPSLVPLRKAMANDITTLKAVPLVDREGLVLRLTSLQQKVDQLPLANAILPDAPESKTVDVSDDISNWKDNLMTSLKGFSDNFITFRTRDGNAIPLLSPEQHFYLRENVKAQLSIAIKSVYDEQQALYSTALKTALSWSSGYFSLEDNNVNQFNQLIKQLAEQNVQVNYPVKMESQTLLSDVINDRLRREVTSLIKEEE